VAGAQTLELTRNIDGLDENGYFIPGTTSLTVTVSIELTSGDAGDLTAFGLEERWPAGFTFASASGACNPAVKPPVGTAGTLGFAYIEVPAFPCTFTYVMNVDGDPTFGDVTGEPQYRTDGPQISGPTETDTVELEPLTVEVTREIVGLDENGYFVPGTPSLTVTLTVDVTSGDPAALTAFGVEERWPAGFTFASASGACNPAIKPSVGAASPMGFAYIEVPTFPCTFTYVVNAAAPALPGSVDGESQYRTDGPQLLGPTVSDVLQVEPTTTSFTRALSGPGVEGDYFLPGQQITVNIEIDKSGPKNVTALGFEDLVPAGWTYVSASGANVPDVRPAAGATDTFGFAYIAVPAFPASFSYVIQVPASTEVAACFEGVVQFRTDGGQELSDADLVCLDPKPCLSFTRVAPASYVAGENLTVEITIDGDCPTPVTALGFDEVIPAGWTYVSAGGPNTPDVRPSAGASGSLGFAYIAVPTLPATFTYTVAVPAEATGTVELSGNVAYRLTGGPLASETVVTEILDVDTVDPEAICQDITVQLDAAGTASIVAEDIDNGSTDNVGVVSLVASQTDFTCDDLPEVTVILTVADAEGNEDTCEAIVTVEDNINPFVVAEDATVVLDAAGAGAITAATVVTDSGDNCSGPSITISNNGVDFVETIPVSCANVGAPITITVRAIDSSGNEATDTATVTVADQTAPLLTTRAATVTLNAAGQGTLAPAAVVQSATDNCGTPVVTLSRSAFTCADLGPVTINVTATDAQGLQTIRPATVTVVDTTAPTLTTKPATVTLDADGAGSIVNADVVDTSSDNCGAPTITLSRSTFTCADRGPVVIQVTATDGSGRATTVNATVTVVDATDPTLTTKAATVTLNAAGTGSITSADVVESSDDNCGAPTITLSRSTFTCADTVAPVVVEVTATDVAGRQVTVDATVTVVDATKPVITLSGATTINLTCGDTYAEPGFTASDNCAGNLTADVVVSGDTVNPSVPATYTVRYNVSDGNGNNADERTRTVIVAADTVGPVISINGPNPRTIECGATFTNPTATALDACDGSTPTPVASGTVNTLVPNTYTVTYTASDNSSNESSVELTVIVADSTAPVITLNGDNPLVLTCGAAFTEPGFTASDTCAGDLTSQVAVGGQTVNVSVPGDYVITYNVSDGNGNNAIEQSRTVTVSPDTVGPVITITGGNTRTVECSTTAFVNPAATVLDACDGSANAATVTGTVNSGVPNTYTLTYKAKDNSDNETTATLTVTVADTTVPVITVTGANPLTIDCGTTFTDPGATVADTCDSNPTLTVTGVGAVNTAEPGTFTITYNAKDAAGNNAEPKTRQVIVAGDSCFDECDDDTVAPVITVQGANPVTVDCGSTYVDAGATATDNCDASVSVVTNDSAVNTAVQNAAGYTVTFTATDAAGNVTNATRTVIVNGPNCDTTCQVGDFLLTAPAGTRLAFGEEDGATVSINLSSSVVVLANPGLCSFEVEYSIDGTVVATSADDVNGFPASAGVTVGSTVLITATLLDADTGQVFAVDSRTVSIVAVLDTNNDGIPDDPFGDLPADGDSYNSVTETPNCDRVTRLVTVVGQANPGDANVVITLTNPDDPTQTFTATVPRALVLPGETAVIVVRIACDPEGLVFPADATELTSDLPATLQIAGAIFADVSIIISSDGGATFSEIPEARVQQFPVGLCMTGLAPTPGLRHDFQSHPTQVGEADFSIQPATGAWSASDIISSETDGGELCGETTHLSAFGPFEQLKQGPTLKVTPNPAFDRVVGIVRVGDSVNVSFTAANVGSGNITGSASLAGGGGAFTLVGSTSYNLNSGQAGTVTVRFTPPSANDFSATLTFTSQNGNQTVTLLGSGTETKNFNIFGCGPAGQGGNSRGDLAVVLLAAGMLLALTQIRRVRQH
jgi:hypothetical protein